MRRFGPIGYIVLVLLLYFGCSGRIRSFEALSTVHDANPFEAEKLFVDPYSQAAAKAGAARGYERIILNQIAIMPQADWIGDWTPDLKGTIKQYLWDARSIDALRVMVAYNLPNRDCGGHSKGGVEEGESYRAWISEFAAAIGRRKAVIILEPDQEARVEMIRFAVTAFRSRPRTAVYIDAGNANWVAAEEMAKRLKRAGIEKATGFAVNVSNYIDTEKSVAYGMAISDALGGTVPFVVDTSRNGRGAAPDNAWCNPEGRGLGHVPTWETGDSRVHAFLWIKRPGESDGACNGGPPAGEWYHERALELVRNARLR
jgi:endoglucanase